MSEKNEKRTRTQFSWINILEVENFENLRGGGW